MEKSAVILGLSRQAKLLGLPMPVPPDRPR